MLKVSSATVCREVSSIDAEDDDPEPPGRLVASILTEPERYPVIAVKRCHYLVDAGTGRGHVVRLGPAVWARSASGGDGFRTAPLIAGRIAEAVVTTTEGAMA